MLTKERLSYLGITLGTTALVLLSYSAGLFSGPEAALEDTLFSNKPISSEIVIVAIDDASIQELGQWPWPRATFAKLLDKLAPFKPQVVGIDVLFSEPSRLGATDDMALAQAIARVKYPIVLAAQAPQLTLSRSNLADAGSADTWVYPIPVLADSRPVGELVSIGLVNVISDRDGIVRQFSDPISFDVQSGMASFAGAIVDESDGPQWVSSEDISSGAVTIDEGDFGIRRIVFAGPPGSVRTVSASDLLAGTVTNLENKIILIGATAESLHDSQKTPVGGGSSMQGVEIHAQIVNMLLMGYQLKDLSPVLAYAWMILVSLIAMFVLLLVKRFEAAIAINAVLGIGYLIAGVALFESGVVVNFIHLTLAWLLTTIALSLYRFFSSEKERRMIRQTFSKYVAPHVLNELLAHPERVALGGEEREVTVLFSDIRGFTSLSEQTTPIELVRILNTYFSRVTKEIIDHDGVLDKYIGDAIMAFWGAPIENPHQADQAVEAARGMIRALTELNKEFKAKGDPEINIGVGIYTGKAVVGNIGSEHRFDYTVIGDTVNAASRIEGLNKEYGTHIIIGESTKQKLTKPFSLTPLGDAPVKGKAEKITIYGVEK